MRSGRRWGGSTGPAPRPPPTGTATWTAPSPPAGGRRPRGCALSARDRDLDGAGVVAVEAPGIVGERVEIAGAVHLDGGRRPEVEELVGEHDRPGGIGLLVRDEPQQRHPRLRRLPAGTGDLRLAVAQHGAQDVLDGPDDRAGQRPAREPAVVVAVRAGPVGGAAPLAGGL